MVKWPTVRCWRNSHPGAAQVKLAAPAAPPPLPPLANCLSANSFSFGNNTHTILVFLAVEMCYFYFLYLLSILTAPAPCAQIVAQYNPNPFRVYIQGLGRARRNIAALPNIFIAPAVPPQSLVVSIYEVGFSFSASLQLSPTPTQPQTQPQPQPQPQTHTRMHAACIQSVREAVS
jgi:hypothetical protein